MKSIIETSQQRLHALISRLRNDVLAGRFCIRMKKRAECLYGNVPVLLQTPYQTVVLRIVPNETLDYLTLDGPNASQIARPDSAFTGGIDDNVAEHDPFRNDPVSHFKANSVLADVPFVSGAIK